jgi:site-specific DNA recombinase
MPSSGHNEDGTERVALLLRVSSEEQRERETIEIQREFLQEYCRLYGLQVAQIYADDGVSGTIPLHERPEGRRLLEDAKEGEFSTVLVYRLDRLGRSLLVTVDAHDRLQYCGVALKSATEPIDTSNPSGRLIFQMLASFAEYERETIRERTRAGLHRAYRGGKHFGAAPYGYRTDESGLLQVVSEEAEIVREIIENVAEGSTLYAEAKRLNDLGLPTPGWRYGGGKKRPGAKLWSVMTVSNIVRQSAYSGVHRVKTNDGKDVIEQPVPAVVEPGLQERAMAVLEENNRYPDRKNERKYLLRSLVRCATCGGACTGHNSHSRGKTYHYYACRAAKTYNFGVAPPHKASFVSAEWLEDLVWSADAGDLEARKNGLAKRLAAKQAEKDRYVRTYAQGHISEEELDAYLVELKKQIDNLRVLLASVEAELSERQERKLLTDTTQAWLLSLGRRLEEVEENTPEAFEKRKQLVGLLVAEVTVGKKPEDARTEVRITYRFGPPPASGSAGSPSQGGLFVPDVKNGSRS